MADNAIIIKVEFYTKKRVKDWILSFCDIQQLKHRATITGPGTLYMEPLNRRVYRKIKRNLRLLKKLRNKQENELNKKK